MTLFSKFLQITQISAYNKFMIGKLISENLRETSMF